MDTLYITSSLKKIAKSFISDKKIIFVCGGIRSGKTISIIMLIINYLSDNKNKKVCVITNTYNHLSKNLLPDFEEIFNILKFKYKINKKNNTIIFNGNRIIFYNADSEINMLGNEYDIVYINEAQVIDKNIAYTALMRCKQKFIVDFNPSNKFWFFNLINERNDDYELIKLTYKDNEALSNEMRDELENISKKLRNKNSFWQKYATIYIDGNFYTLDDDKVLNNYIVENVNQASLYNNELLAIGVDFGYTNDVTAIVEIFNYKNSFLINEAVYSKRLGTKEIADCLKKYNKNIPILCDNSEPRLINELSIMLNNKNIIGVKYNIIYSLNVLNMYELYINSKSLNLIYELDNYTFIKNKLTGENTNIPKDVNNHAIDAMRYAITFLHENKKNRNRYQLSF